MGNEASLEGGAAGGGAPGQPSPLGAAKPPSAPGSGGQLPGRAAAPAPADSTPRRLDQSDFPVDERSASPSLKQSTQTHESTEEILSHGQASQQADGPRRTLQVDTRIQKPGRSPSVSPDRSSTPTSPYSVPQIAPLPSSTLCPICKTTELTSSPNQPNFNTCTQCHSKVCNQCGFNPNPHLTEVKEWLCLNCQMQRALGMDMTTAPRSKSQQQLHSPSLSPSHSPAKHPQPQLLAMTGQEKLPGNVQLGIGQGAGVLQSESAKPSPAAAQKEPRSQGQPNHAAPQEVVRSSPQHQAKLPSYDQRQTLGDSPAKTSALSPSAAAQEQSQEGLTGKLFGFGASLLTQASTLMSVQPEATPQSQQSSGKVPPKIVFSDASKEAGLRSSSAASGAQGRAGTAPATKQSKAEQDFKPKEVPKERVMCPLCKSEINVGSGEPSNYNSCTTCKQQVCNMCGFNPTPHLMEKNEWLCLNCQTQRLLEGSLGDPSPMPLPASKPQPTGSPRHQAERAGQQRGVLQPVTVHKSETSAPQDRYFVQAKHLRTSEPSKLQDVVQESKPAGPSEEKPLPKLSAEAPKVPESASPKGKSMAGKPEAESKPSKAVIEAQQVREQEETSKPYPHDLSRSPQSLSDTGYSSDGISSSQSEITGLVQQEEELLNGTGLEDQSPASPSELTKLESSVRPLLESKGISQEHSDRGKMFHELREEQRHRQRPRSLSITPEAFDSDEELEDIMEEDEDSLEWENQRDQRESMDSSDDFGSKLRHDYVEDSSEGGISPLPSRLKGRETEMTDEEFMRRQILEMSAEEDNLEEEEEEEEEEEDYDHVKYSVAKRGHKPDTEKSKEPTSSKRRLPHISSSMYEEEKKEMEAVEGEDVTTSQGGLRRFKTIELNSTSSYSRDMELSQDADISLDREPELEMESLTGSPDERSRGEYSSTLPATTPSYTSGTSPTSLSSLEEDSDSSPSRRQRLEEVKQQRKARHRCHGPLLPTIEDSSEEDELREEEELLREQEKMREVEQQRIRSTARKTKRDKEELRAQRRRERSKTPPSNLSPIEDASPTEELRQAAEMEELHRSSCSEYSPSIDSEAEGFDGIASKLYKSGSEYNLPTFMSLYSPTEKTDSSSRKPLKSAEEAYEEMMRKAELFQKQQVQQSQQSAHSSTYQQVGYHSAEGQSSFEYQYIDEYSYDNGHTDSSPSDYQHELSEPGAVYEEILQTSQSISRMHQSSSFDLALEEEEKRKEREETYQEKQFLNAESAYADLMKQNSGPLTPGTSPTQLLAPVSFSSSEGSTGRLIPDVRVTQHFAKEGHDHPMLHSSPAAARTMAAPCTYSRGSSTITTVVSSLASAPRIYSSSLSGSDGTPVSSPSRSYSQMKGTANHSSQTEDSSESQRVAELSGASAREKLQSKSESKINVSVSSKMYSYARSTSPPLPPMSPIQIPAHSAPRAGQLASRTMTEFSTQTQSTVFSYDCPTTTGISTSSPMIAQGTQTTHRTSSPRLARQQSSQEAPFMVITLASDASSQTKPTCVYSSTSPASSPTQLSLHQAMHSYSQTAVSSAPLQREQLQSPYAKTQTVIERASAARAMLQKGHSISAAESTAGVYSWGPLPAENISLCKISSVPGTARVEPGPKPPTSNAVDLRTAIKAAPIIITDQGMDLTSLATESRKYCLTREQTPSRQSTTVQPLIINLNAQEQPHAIIGTASTVSMTVASSMFVAQPKPPVLYGDPFQDRMDFGAGAGSPVCLTHVKQVEQAVQTGTFRGSMSSIGISAPSTKPEAASPQPTKFARYNLPNQMMPLVKKDVLITQTSSDLSAVSISTGPRPIPQNQSTDLCRGTPVELKTQSPPINLGGKKSQAMVVQMNEIAAGPVTKLFKEEPPASALDLTGIKSESKVACCDVVYKFPFGSTCTGTFNPSPKIPEKNVGDVAPTGKPSIQYYGNREPDLPETYPYREQMGPAPRLYEEHRFYPQGLSGRLYSSMSDTNLSEIGLNYYPPAGDSAVDLTTMKHSYSISFTEGGYLRQGMQYGSFSDLRQPTDLLSHPLPMRRYSSASNIYSDYRYPPRGDLANFQESSLAQYSATTAREISRMCAALNSMDQYGARHSNSPDLLQYGPAGGSSVSAPQGISAIKPNMMYNPNFPETHQAFGNLAQYSLSGARLGAVRQIFPSTATVRAADGMIYSTINTPIASTLPITTQPASVLRPMLRGLYRPYTPGSITAVPLANLTRVPLVTPRVPLAATGLYRYSAPSRFPSVSTTSTMETPMYLGKPVSTNAASTAASNVSPGPAAKVLAPASVNLQQPEQMGADGREEGLTAAASLQSASKDSQHQQPAPPVHTQQAEVVQASGPSKGNIEREEKEKEEERQRKQQEHILQLERERVELEKLRQLRLHEELERERVELQRHREKEQMLVHREIQELQSIKHQVLQQQQEERQAQFALQREQLAQQRLQLEQIQQLQQQLQQQLEEQKRQKSTFPPVCDPTGRVPPQAMSERALEMQRTLAQNGQYWPPLNQAFMAPAAPGQEGPVPSRYPGLQRPLTNSASEMSLQPEEQWEASRGIKKRNSMPRLRDAYDKEALHEPYMVKKITDSSVQTDEEDGEERYFLSRRRRTRRSTDCSVQTDEEDNAEWEQPVRRRRSRFSRHSDSSAESKQDSSKGMASIGIQTSSDCSVQTEPDQLPRVSPSIHITTPDPKVEIVKYISAPEKTQRGESLACQTELESQLQPGVVVPQLTVPTTITPYSANIQLVSTSPLDARAIRHQALGKFEKKKPDPLEIGYQSHLPAESLSQLVACQPPKSPQVLYSPVSPLSPHRLLESSFTTSERLNKAHVTPQKHFTADSTQRQQTLPRPIKTMQRSFSDPKPTSPTSEESGRDRFSIYQHPFLQGSQISALQSNTLMRKVKRTLPSPPPEEAHLPLASQAHSQLYLPSFLPKGVGGQAAPVTKASLLRDIDRDLKLVEHESTKLRKKQAELDEEEKEIDAKLKYLELGITQRKESLLKDRGGRDYPYPRCLGENRDYMSDSELNNLRLSSYEGNRLLSRPSTAPTNHYADFSSMQYTSAPSYAPYPYPAAPPGPDAFQQPRLQPPHYPMVSSGISQNGFQAGQLPTLPAQGVYQTQGFPSSTSYQSQQGFRPPHHYQAQAIYPSQPPLQPAQSTSFQTQAEVHAMHQKPRQTSLADLEQKIPTNYEVIANASAAPEATHSPTPVTSSYAQHKGPEPRPADQSNAAQSPSASYSSEALYTNLEQNIPRNYVMIDDISELTKETPAADSHKGETVVQGSNGRQAKEKSEVVEPEGSSRTCCYSKAEEESEEDMYDQHGADHRGKNSYHRGMESNGRMSGSSSSPCSYYGDDYRHSARPDKHGSGLGMQKHSSKNLAPAVISSKRSKHRKQGMEQKISKFSPIEEAKDVESDLASYTVTTSVSSSNVVSRAKKLQDEITYGLKKNVYEQQKYYGVSSRDMMEEDDRAYSTGSRSRSSAYGTEKSLSRDTSSRSKSYERESLEKPQKGSSKPSSLSMGQSRGRPPIRAQTSEEESPISPLGKSVGMSRSSGGPLPQSSGDSCSQFCSSHSLPDVQEHTKDVPRNHSYKHEESYILDDSHCVVSDSEAYHLGQEETDWFDKPREARSERVRPYTGHSSQKRPPVKHTFHDYDEPPDEGLWQHDDYSQARHSSSKDHRHHGESGRHSATSRHPSEDQPRRTSKQHTREQGRHEARTHMQPSAQKKTQQSDTRVQPAFPSSSAEQSQQSRQPASYHHSSESLKSQRQVPHGPSPQQVKAEPLTHHPQQQLQTRQQQPLPSRQQQPSAKQPPQQQAGPSQQLPQPQKEPQQQQARMQQQPGTQGPPSSRPPQQQPNLSQQVGKPQSSLPAQPGSHQAGPPKADQVDMPKPTTKVPLLHGRAPQGQPLGTAAAGIKVSQKPTGTAAGQPGVDGESVFSKILQGGAAEQAGKLTEAVSAFGKKFTSFW